MRIRLRSRGGGGREAVGGLAIGSVYKLTPAPDREVSVLRRAEGRKAPGRGEHPAPRSRCRGKEKGHPWGEGCPSNGVRRVRTREEDRREQATGSDHRGLGGTSTAPCRSQPL